MSKCHVAELQELWAAILTDAARKFPTLESEFCKDLARLQRAVANRGIRVFLEDLVSIGKHFDRCLSCGLYKLSGLPLTKRYSNTVVIPKFLRGLYLQIFHSSGQLKEDCNVEAVQFVRQLTLAFKKGKLRCTAENNEKEVVEFYAVDSALPEPEGFWGGVVESVHDRGPGQDGSRVCTRERPLRGQDPLFRQPVNGSEGGTDGSRPALQGAGQGNSVRSQDPTEVLASSTAETPKGEVRGENLGGRGLIYEGFSKSALYQGRVSTLDPQKRIELSRLLATLDFVSGVVTATLGPYDPSIWRFRHGPGAVSEYRGPANKYCWTNWADTLESEYPIADYGFHSFSSWADRVHTRTVPSSKELCSRMVCVPKTYSKPRLIAAEPSANQWCQQNMWHYFCNRTQDTWIGRFIRFRDQSRNQDLCTIGSRDGTLATVDLSAASDRVTCHIVGQMFRKNPRLLNCLRASRTQRVEQTVTKRVPSEIRLRKFSTMGNACTFPVESLIFLSIAISCVLTKRGLRCTMGNIKALSREVAVFGDDLIIPVDCRELLVEALEVLDFKVNVAKSYWTGRFRESCGIDAFRGHDVTPAYWRTFNDGKPESLASTVETRNNFYKKSLYTAADRLASTIRKDIPYVHTGSGAFGLKSATSLDYSGFKTRWNPALQRTEVFVATLIARQEKTAIEDDSALLQYFTEDPEPFTKWSSGIPQRPLVKIRQRWVALSDLNTPCAKTQTERELGICQLRLMEPAEVPSTPFQA